MRRQLLVDPQPALDAAWSDKLSAILSNLPEVYSFLEPEMEELSKLQKQFVKSGFRDNPDLRVNTNADLYTQTNHKLHALKKELDNSEQNDVIRQAYTSRIDELTTHHALPVAVVDHDTQAFSQLNQQLYGQPDPGIFAATCAWLRQLADRHTIGAEAVLQKIPDLDGNITAIIPDPAVFAAVRDMHFVPGGFIDQLFQNTVIPEHVNEQVGTPIVEQILQNVGSDYRLCEAPVFWGVSHASKSVYYAADYDLPRAEFSGIIAHEIGSHLLEHVNGSHQPLQLLAAGLDHYDHCNEGRAYLREQIFYESIDQALLEPSWEHIITMHLAISFACGLHDHPYTFAEVYEVLLAVGTLLELARGTKSVELAQQKAHKQAWITSVRTLKGTDGTGGAYLKDIVYLEGNSKCWAAAKKDPSIIMLGDLGKFDLFREDHLKLLRDLSIID